MLIKLLERYPLGVSTTDKIHIIDPMVLSTPSTALCGTRVWPVDVVDPAYGMLVEGTGIRSRAHSVNYVLNNSCQHCTAALHRKEAASFRDQIWRECQEAREKMIEQEAPKVKTKNMSASEEVLSHLATLRRQLNELSTELNKRGVCGTEDVYTPCMNRLRYTLAAAIGFAAKVTEEDPNADPRSFGSPSEQRNAPALTEAEKQRLILTMTAKFPVTQNDGELSEILEQIHRAIAALSEVGEVTQGELCSKGAMRIPIDVHSW